MIGVDGIAGLFLPKVETPRRGAALGQHDRRARSASAVSTAGAIKLVLSIESALGVLNAYDMSIAAARVVSLTFGGAQDGDLNTDLGCAWSIDGPEMMHARSHTLLAARAARFDTPLDGVFANVRDADGFERDTALSRRLGYRGRKLIHPSQIEPCNRLYRPSEAELDYYARVLDGVRPGGGARQRLDHGRRPHDRRRDGERSAARAGRGGCVEEGGIADSSRRLVAAPNGAVPSSNSSITVPGSAEFVEQADRDALAVGGAHAGDAPRLPVGLAEHVADDRDLLDHRLVDAIRLERVAVAARAEQPLREQRPSGI